MTLGGASTLGGTSCSPWSVPPAHNAANAGGGAGERDAWGDQGNALAVLVGHGAEAPAGQAAVCLDRAGGSQRQVGSHGRHIAAVARGDIGLPARVGSLEVRAQGGRGWGGWGGGGAAGQRDMGCTSRVQLARWRAALRPVPRSLPRRCTRPPLAPRLTKQAWAPVVVKAHVWVAPTATAAIPVEKPAGGDTGRCHSTQSRAGRPQW